MLIVGLGNPGRQYEMTRHNIGFLTVDAFARKMNWQFKEDRRFNALITKGEIDGATVHLIKPMTFMNLSGIAVKRYLDFFKFNHSRLLVVADDIALPFGHMRLRLMGSAGGHNGLKSIEHHLETSHYMRLRMGIGSSGDQVLAQYVLDTFDQEEMLQLESFIDRGVDVLRRFLNESPSHLMNAINARIKNAPEGVRRKE